MENSLVIRKGAWAAAEDLLLKECIEKYGEGKWHHVPLRSGLKRCGKSCRLRWLNYLRPNIKRGQFTLDEIDLIHRLHKLLGNRWSLIAGRLPGRTANDIKNYWNTHMKKKPVSPGGDVKANTQETEEKKVIKPLPRTFSKNSLWLRRRETTSIDTNQLGDILAMSSIKFPPDDGTQWWENVLFGKEEEKETSCSIVGPRGELFSSLCDEEMEATTRGGDIFGEEGKSTDWGDFFFDVNLWF